MFVMEVLCLKHMEKLLRDLANHNRTTWIGGTFQDVDLLRHFFY